MCEIIYGWILDTFVAPGATLKQGDLIKFENQTDPIRKAGIVVTADCDLELKKHAKLVTLIPVVPIKVILENYLLPEDCEKKRIQIESYAFKAFEIEKDPELETRKATLREKIKNLPSTPKTPEIIAALFTIDNIDYIPIAEYKLLMETINSGIKKPSELSKQISSRGDILVLPTPEKLGVNGGVAWVRNIWQEQLSSIAIRTSEVNVKQGERVARLDSPFRYRLTQLMAQVFSDIGLPNIPSSIEQNIQDVYDHV